MGTKKQRSKRSKHTGGKVAGGAVVLALLLAGGHFGLGIGREGGGLLNQESVDAAAQTVSETIQGLTQSDAQTAEPVQGTVTEVVVPSPEDDGVLTITVQEDRLLYEGREVTISGLEESLLRDYIAGTTPVELKDDHAIKAAYDEVNALLQKLNIPFTEGK